MVRAGMYSGIIGAVAMAQMARQVFTRSSDPTAYYGWWVFLVPLVLFASGFFASWWYGRASLLNRGDAARAGSLAGVIAGLGILLIQVWEPSEGLEGWVIIGPSLGVVVGAVGGALGWRRRPQEMPVVGRVLARSIHGERVEQVGDELWLVRLGGSRDLISREWLDEALKGPAWKAES